MKENDCIRDLTLRLLLRISEEDASFESFYFKVISEKIVLNQDIDKDKFFVYLKTERFDSVDKLHKLSVIFNLFFKNDTALSDYIINMLLNVSKPLSRYTLKTLFLYLSCADKLNFSPCFLQSCVQYVDSFKGENGAFSNYYHTQENIGATFDALFILKWVVPSFVPQYETLDFVNKCYCANQGFATKPENGKVTISSIFDGFFIYESFGIKREALKDDIIKYIEKSYNFFTDKQLFQGIIILKTLLDKNTNIFDLIY